MDDQDLELQILKGDIAKVTFTIPKRLLMTVCLWPTQLMNCRIAQIWFYVKLLLMVCLEFGQLLYVAFNLSDVEKLSNTLSTLSTTLQGIVKSCIIYHHRGRLLKILKINFHEFWPADLLNDAKLEKSLEKTSKWLHANMYFVGASAAIFAFTFLTKPLLEGKRVLPFDSWYPFIDFTAAPVYELIYCLQVFTNLFVIIFGILGHDYLFLAFCANVVAQFRLLKRSLDHLGDVKKFEKIYKTIPAKQTRYLSAKSESEKLLVEIVEHHNKLLDVCYELEAIFSPSLFVQLATSGAAICVSSFLLSAIHLNSANLFNLTSYCLGHVMQLFIICVAGSELSYQSETLCRNAYTNKWYEEKGDKMKKSLGMIMVRSQRFSRLTALGIVPLNYVTFVAVMRLSFSFYTLLSTMAVND